MRFVFVAVRYLLKKKIFTKHTFKIISKAMKFFCIPAQTVVDVLILICKI